MLGIKVECKTLSWGLCKNYVQINFFFIVKSQTQLLNANQGKKSIKITYLYEPKLSMQVPPCPHGLLWHSLTSSLQSCPLKPGGQMHLYLPLGANVHFPPFLHGENAQRFDFSQNFPIDKKIIIKIWWEVASFRKWPWNHTQVLTSSNMLENISCLW